MLAERTKNSCSIFCKILQISSAKRLMSIQHTIYHGGYFNFEQVYKEKNDVFKLFFNLVDQNNLQYNVHNGM